MKRPMILVAVVCLVLSVSGLLLGGCGATDTTAAPPPAPVPDPPDTVRTNLRLPRHGIYAMDFETGQVGDANLAGCDLRLDNNTNFHPGDPAGGSGPASLFYVGPVSGLGYITQVPTAGSVASCAGVKGHGYVVRTTDGNTFRVYGHDYLLSAIDQGIIGLRIKWASL